MSLYNPSNMIEKEITDTELVFHLNSIHKDEMEVFIMADGLYRGAFFHGTHFINRMRAQHNLGILETMILGQAALCAALMIPTMKGKERLIFKYECNGKAKGFSVEANSTGWIRGYLLKNPIPLEKPLENWDLEPFLGEGIITISRFSENAKLTHVGTTEIKYKNIAKDLTWYFLQSEQIKTAFNTSIQFDKKGRVIGAGGLFLQRMPSRGGTLGNNDMLIEKRDGLHRFTEEHAEEITQRVENAFKAAPSFGEWFSQNGDLEDIIFGLFREFSPQKALTRDISWHCPCTRESFLKSLQQIGPDEFKKNGDTKIAVTCQNCSTSFTFSIDEL